MSRRTPNLRRRQARRDPRLRFILLCEGRNTEPAYFRALKQTCTSALISVEIVGGIGVPYTIAERAVAHFRELRGPRRRKRDSFEGNDQVWAVFDRDEHPRFSEAITLCEQHGIHVGRSNPCFELWLILHEQDYDRYETRHRMQEIFKRLRPEYHEDAGKMPNCDELITRVDQAEQRAKGLLERRRQADDPYGNPSTTVGRLTHAIRVAHERAQP